MRAVDICAGKTVTVSCSAESSSHMVFITRSYHGIQNQAAGKCGFTPGDCTEDLTINACKSNASTCALFASNSKSLNKCGNKRANYLRIEYQCVPCKRIDYFWDFLLCSLITAPEFGGLVWYDIWRAWSFIWVWILDFFLNLYPGNMLTKRGSNQIFLWDS